MANLGDVLKHILEGIDLNNSDRSELAHNILNGLWKAGYQVLPLPSSADELITLNMDAAMCPLCRAEHQFSKVDPETGETIFYPAHNAGTHERLEKMLENWKPAWANDEPATPDTPIDAPHPYLPKNE